MEPLTRVTFTVPGEPVAQPRMAFRPVVPKDGGRPFVVRTQDPNHPVFAYRKRIRTAYLRAARRKLTIDTRREAVLIRVLAVFPVPESRYRKSQHNLVFLKVTVPDRDNIEKAVMDALKGAAWDDDAAVAVGGSAKLEAMDATKARTEVTLEVVPRLVGVADLQRELEFVL
ncbi:MAG: RusA family crossover junction endodeoxyribonuclease [Pirellulales bacterium]|nr:RusA family crossover junction endodeoxyribonuclease [Pirellulales bacterium]